MREPECTKRSERRNGQQQVAILGALAAMDVYHHPLAVDVADLQVDRFANPQKESEGGRL
jgi:hypothetical protein